MKWFKHKRQSTNVAGSDKAASWLATSIAKVQAYWAKGMDRMFNRLSGRWKKITLIGACFLMALYSTAMIAFSFSTATALIAKPIAAIQPLSILPGAMPMPEGTPSYIRGIESFKKYLDSLGNTLDGRRIRDSILKGRPGLPDSIKRIETIYCKQ